MPSALAERTIAELDAVRQYVALSAKARALSTETSTLEAKCPELSQLFQVVPDATSWRIIDHSNAITRSYALFERFVLGSLQEYLGFLTRTYPFEELGSDFRMRYTRGIGQILLNQQKARFSGIDIGVLLSEVSAAITNRSPYQMQPEALLQTEQNLRMPELERLFGNCGLSGVSQWISAHSPSGLSSQALQDCRTRLNQN